MKHLIPALKKAQDKDAAFIDRVEAAWQSVLKPPYKVTRVHRFSVMLQHDDDLEVAQLSVIHTGTISHLWTCGDQLPDQRPFVEAYWREWDALQGGAK